MELNIFELAARKKLRFASTKNDLTTEQLFDLPLESKDGFNLDTVARTVNTDLKACAEESFVATSTNPAKAIHELKLAIVKFIIADKQAVAAAKADAAARLKERARLVELLDKKNDQALEALTPAEIQARIDALGK